MFVEKSDFTSEEQKQLEHARRMAEEFSPERVKALRAELEFRQKDIREILPYVNITTEEGKAKFWKLQGELELIDMWLRLPEKTKSFIQGMKDKIQRFFVH